MRNDDHFDDQTVNNNGSNSASYDDDEFDDTFSTDSDQRGVPDRVLKQLLEDIENLGGRYSAQGRPKKLTWKLGQDVTSQRPHIYGKFGGRNSDLLRKIQNKWTGTIRQLDFYKVSHTCRLYPVTFVISLLTIVVLVPV